MHTYKLPPGTLYVLQIQNLHIQINLRMPNPRQIIAVICQNADGRVHVEQPPLLLNRSTMMVAVAIAVAVSGPHHHPRRCPHHCRCRRQAVAADNAANAAAAAAAAAAISFDA